jgi:hypothetical protein
MGKLNESQIDVPSRQGEFQLSREVGCPCHVMEPPFLFWECPSGEIESTGNERALEETYVVCCLTRPGAL